MKQRYQIRNGKCFKFCKWQFLIYWNYSLSVQIKYLPEDMSRGYLYFVIMKLKLRQILTRCDVNEKQSDCFIVNSYKNTFQLIPRS